MIDSNCESKKGDMTSEKGDPCQDVLRENQEARHRCYDVTQNNNDEITSASHLVWTIARGELSRILFVQREKAKREWPSEKLVSLQSCLC